MLDCHMGTCEIKENKQTCKCRDEYTGEFCNIYRCSGFCKNHGLCKVDVMHLQDYKDDSLPPLKCECTKEWSGQRCEIPIRECRELCHNGAECRVRDDNKEECVCPDGFSGNKCQYCEDLRCENDGTCKKNITTGNSYCDCAVDYSGIRCEKSVCEGYCNGHGNCTTGLGKATCQCERGYWGNQCDYESNQCKCNNGGTCVMDQLSNKYYCRCPDDWEGENCEIPLDQDNICAKYCKNNGICELDGNLSPKCQCINDWTGDTCDQPPDCAGSCGECISQSVINECR